MSQYVYIVVREVNAEVHGKGQELLGANGSRIEIKAAFVCS